MPFPTEVTEFAEEVDGRVVSVAYDLAARAPIPRVRDEDAVRLARRWELKKVVGGRRAFSIARFAQSCTELRVCRRGGVGGWKNPTVVAVLQPLRSEAVFRSVKLQALLP